MYGPNDVPVLALSMFNPDIIVEVRGDKIHPIRTEAHRDLEARATTEEHAGHGSRPQSFHHRVSSSTVPRNTLRSCDRRLKPGTPRG